MKWVAEQQSLDEVTGELGRQSIIAVDTEADSLHSYFDKVCLIQTSTLTEDAVIDPLAKIDLARFGEILADPKIVKVLHGADYDLRILNRDFGFTISNLIDTMICSQLLGYEGIGLAALLKKHFNADVDKSNQRADWAMRPLSAKMLDYATRDTHYLIPLSRKLREELETLGRWGWAEEEFKRLETIRFREPDPDAEGFRKIKGTSKLDRRNLAVLASLHQWRDSVARKLDRPPFKVLGNEILVSIATTIPRAADELSAIKGVSPYVMSKNGKDLLQHIEKAMALTEDELPSRSEARPWMRDKELERKIEKLKKVRDRIAEDLKIDPSVLAPKHVLSAIAADSPKTVEDLSHFTAMREWQKSVAAPALLEALHRDP